MPEGVGTGISLQGKLPDHSQQWINIFNRGGELAYRRDQIKKKKEADEFAKLNDFTINSKDLTPKHAYLIAQEKKSFVDEYYKAKNSGLTAEQALQSLWKTHADTQGKIQQYEAESTRIKTYLNTPATENAPLQSKLAQLAGNPDSTPEQWAELNQPELGGTLTSTFGFEGITHKKVDLGDLAKKYNVNPTLDEAYLKKNPPRSIGGGMRLTELKFNTSPDAIEGFKTDALGNPDNLFQLYLDAQNLLKTDRPDLLQNFYHPNPDERIKAQQATAIEVGNRLMPSKTTYDTSVIAQPSVASQNAAKKQPTLTHAKTDVYHTREQMREREVGKEHAKNVDAMYDSFKNSIDGKAAIEAAGATKPEEIDAVITELIDKKYPNFRTENGLKETLDIFTIEKPDDKQNAVFEFNNKGTVYRDASPSDIIIRNNKPYARLFIQSTSTKEGVPPRSREIEIPYEGTTRARLNKEFNTDNLLRDELQNLNFDADKIINAWDKKGANTQKQEPKKTKKDDPLGLFD